MNDRLLKHTRNEKIVAVLYLIGLIIAEVSVTYINKEAGLVIESFILFLLLFNSSLNVSYNYSVMLRSMMVLPLIRIIGLSLPLMQVQPLYWFPVVAVPLFAAVYTIMKSQGLSRRHVGLIWGNKKIQFLIALSGILLGTIEFLILKPAPLIAVLNPVTLISASIILIISTGLAEELLFRGIIQKNAENVFGTIAGLLYTALLFTALHIGWNSLIRPYICVLCCTVLWVCIHENTKYCWCNTITRNIQHLPIFDNPILCINALPFNLKYLMNFNLMRK